MQSEAHDLIQWLLDEGGPVIRYRTLVELAGYAASSDCEAALNAMLQTEKTRWLLDQLDRFGPLTRVDIGTLNALHGMKPTCLENIIPQLDDIVTYVTDERYRAFPPGYGYIWSGDNRRMCYACGWNLDLPDLDSAKSYE